MDRRLKLLILVLLAAVICLSVGIASLRMSGRSGGQTASEAQPAVNGSQAIQLYQENGHWGARTANGRELIAPTWAFLRAMSDSVLIARRGDSRSDKIGLIRTNGELLVPFLYQSIAPADAQDTNVWLATMQENGKTCYHLYKADGTLWMTEAWDSAEYQNGILDAAKGANRCQCRLTRAGIEWLARYEEYPVGLYKLVMDFDSAELSRMPDAQTLSGLGDCAAYYLRYLFTLGDKPDDTMLDPESSDLLTVRRHYDGCRLQKAEVSRIQTLETDGLPAYLMQIQVTYLRKNGDGGTDRIKTALTLTVSRSASGGYIYNSFSDSQMLAAGSRLLN